MHNIIEKPYDQPAVIEFDFSRSPEFENLSDFTKIVLIIGDEEYDTLATPGNLEVNLNRLLLNIGASTGLEKGSYPPTIIAYSNKYDDGYPLTTAKNQKIAPIIIY